MVSRDRGVTLLCRPDPEGKGNQASLYLPLSEAGSGVGPAEGMRSISSHNPPGGAVYYLQVHNRACRLWVLSLPSSLHPLQLQAIVFRP